MSELSDQITALRDQGFSYRKIQEALGCSKGTISYYLGEGQVDKKRERQRRIRHTIADYISQVKQDSLCADCGENYPYWIMEFDHLGDKIFTIAAWKGAAATLDMVKEEIAKCEVVCGNCHKNRTYLRARSKPGARFERDVDVSGHYEIA